MVSNPFGEGGLKELAIAGDGHWPSGKGYIMVDINNLKFDSSGLIPAIVQDFRTKEILMLAYMNRESLEVSIAGRKTCFYSRSRGELWHKGETSGNTQEIIAITADCDRDTLLVEVIPAGPACHTGEDTCFHTSVAKFPSLEGWREAPGRFSVDALYSLIEGRKTNRQEGSYTTYLFDKGEDKILKKIGEESAEVIIAAKNNDNAELIYEIADLAYHAMVLMAQKGIMPQQIRDELASRHVVDKKVKQEKMS
jgi:phosphoribosyl-ATP pyrophosphohydrolase/phosphoribosyl-AMP cyclohydrolase